MISEDQIMIMIMRDEKEACVVTRKKTLKPPGASWRANNVSFNLFIINLPA